MRLWEVCSNYLTKLIFTNICIHHETLGLRHGECILFCLCLDLHMLLCSLNFCKLYQSAPQLKYI